MPLPACLPPATASSPPHNAGSPLALPLPPKPVLSAVYSSLACACTALLPTSTASSRRSSAVDCDAEPAPTAPQCPCRSFSSHQWIARKCRDCGHDRAVHRMDGEAAGEAAQAAEDANYAHVGTTVINSGRGQAARQQQRQPPAIVTQPAGEHSAAASGDGDEAVLCPPSDAATTAQPGLMSRQPLSPTVVSSPLSLSSLSPRSPPPPPPIGRSPPAPPSRRPPTSPSPRPAAAAAAGPPRAAQSSPATPLACPAVPPTPPPAFRSAAPVAVSSSPLTAALQQPPDAPLSPREPASANSGQSTPARPVPLAPIAPSPLLSGSSSSGASSVVSGGPASPSPPSSAGPSPIASDYASLHALYSMQSALRAAAESELRQCRAALTQLEATAASADSASAALHVRSLLGSLAAAQKQSEAAQQRAKQHEDELAALHAQLRLERQSRQQACEALQQANQRLSEQLEAVQRELRAAREAHLPAPASTQPPRYTAAEAEEKDAGDRASAKDARTPQQHQQDASECGVSQQTRWASPLNPAPSAIPPPPPPPPLPRRPAQLNGSQPPSCYASPSSSVAGSLTTPLPPPPPPPPPFVAALAAEAAASPSARAPLSSLRAPLSVEGVLYYFHSCLRLSDAYLQYLSHFVEEAVEQHSTHASQMAAVADIASDVEQNAYELLRRIGAGGFGEVYEGRRKKDGERVAIKVIDLELSSEDVATISQEVLSLSSTRLCAQLVSYYGCCVVHTSSLWLVMELVADGSLLHHLQQHGPFSEDAIAIVCKEVLLGLAYMASEGKIHRDVKSANILLNVQRCKVLLTDFGASRQLSDTLKKCNTLIGSPYWMAPEVLLRDNYDGKADIWSLGITLIELATGRPPHAHIPPMQVMQKIVEWPAPTLQSSALPGREYSAPFAAFVSKCLQKDPTQRATVPQLLKHDFIKKAKSKSKIRSLFAERFVAGKQR